MMPAGAVHPSDDRMPARLPIYGRRGASLASVARARDREVGVPAGSYCPA